MVDSKAAPVAFDTDPSLRHRELWNKTMVDLEHKGLVWCDDPGATHVIDEPLDLCPTPEALIKYEWDGTSPIWLAPKLLTAIEEGNVELQKRREKALDISLRIIKEVSSDVNIAHLDESEFELVNYLSSLIPAVKTLDIKLKDMRGIEFREYMTAKNDNKGMEQFDRVSVNMCPGALALVAPELMDYCSPVDYFPNERPTHGTYSPTELAPPDITKEEIEALNAAFPEPMWNPFLNAFTSIQKDPTAPLGWTWTTLSQDPRFSNDIRHLADRTKKATEIHDQDPGITAQLLSSASFMAGTNPFGAYGALSAWVHQKTGNLEIWVGPDTGYAPFGKSPLAKLFVGVVRQGEAEMLEKYYIKNLQGFEDFYASKIDGYDARSMPGDVPVRVVDAIISAGANSAYTTLAFVGPDIGPLSKAGISKRVIIANHLGAKFTEILGPIAEQVLVPEQVKFVDKDLFVMNCAVHECGHPAGPRDYTKVASGERASDAIGDDTFDSIEESKANALALVIPQWMHDQGIKREDGSLVADDVYLKKAYITYVAGLIRQMRFGSKGHGGGAWAEFNYLLSVKAVEIVKVNIGGEMQSRLKVNLSRMPKITLDLAVKIGVIQHTGDKKGAEVLTKNLNSIPDCLEKEILPRVNSKGIPVDVEMEYETHNIKYSRGLH